MRSSVDLERDVKAAIASIRSMLYSTHVDPTAIEKAIAAKGKELDGKYPAHLNELKDALNSYKAYMGHLIKLYSQS